MKKLIFLSLAALVSVPIANAVKIDRVQGSGCYNEYLRCISNRGSNVTDRWVQNTCFWPCITSGDESVKTVKTAVSFFAKFKSYDLTPDDHAKLVAISSNISGLDARVQDAMGLSNFKQNFGMLTTSLDLQTKDNKHLVFGAGALKTYKACVDDCAAKTGGLATNMACMSNCSWPVEVELKN